MSPLKSFPLLPPTLSILAVCSLTACGPMSPAQGGQSGTLVPERCVEVDRILVTDLTEVRPETGHSAQDVIDTVSGSFEGSWRSQELTFDVLASGTGGVELVLIESEEVDYGDGPAPGAPDSMCPEYQWEIGVSVALISLPELDEAATSTLVATAVDQAHVSFDRALDEVSGSLLPDWDPSDYETTTLRLSASYDTDAWGGSLSWSSDTPPVGDGAGQAMVSPSEVFSASLP